MLRRGQKMRGTSFNRWRSGRRELFEGRGPSAARRTFEKDLALFERQAREEAGEGAGRLAGLSPLAVPSA